MPGYVEQYLNDKEIADRMRARLLGETRNDNTGALTLSMVEQACHAMMTRTGDHPDFILMGSYCYHALMNHLMVTKLTNLVYDKLQRTIDVVVNGVKLSRCNTLVEDEFVLVNNKGTGFAFRVGNMNAQYGPPIRDNFVDLSSLWNPSSSTYTITQTTACGTAQPYSPFAFPFSEVNVYALSSRNGL